MSNQAITFIIQPAADLLSKHPHLQALAEQLSEIYAERKQVVTDEALKQVGDALWQAIENDLPSDFIAAEKASGQQPLALIIDSDHAAILQLPWETLHHPQFGFLAQLSGFSLSRRIRRTNTLATHLPALDSGPLRVLLFTSLPDDLAEQGRLKVEDEQAQVLEALTVFEQQGLVQLTMPDDGRFDTFKQLLQTVQPHVVYLSGHGSFHTEPHNNRAWGSFLFEDTWGNSLDIKQEQLAACFEGTQVQALILSACQTGKADSSDLSNGLMHHLAQHGIPHVIGMRESIMDNAGIQFARAFFAAIAHKKRIDIAMKQPLKDSVYRDQQTSLLADLSLGQWCLPMLLSDNIEQPLIDWQFSPQPKHNNHSLNTTLNNISLPQQFLGRRRELRALQNRFRRGEKSVYGGFLAFARQQN